MHPDAIARRMLAPLALLAGLLAAAPAAAAPGTWQTDAGVGPSEVVFTLQLGCANPGFVCDLIDGYLDQDVSTVSGAGSFELDPLLAQLQLDADSLQDIGSGPQPAYLTMPGSDLVFANVPFAGVPQVTDVVVFSVTSPVVTIPGLNLLAPGDYPFSATLRYSGLGTIFGDLEFILGPAIGVPPKDVLLSGIFRVLGDVDLDGNVEYELVDLMASFSFQNTTTIASEEVVVDVTADLTANLSGETAAPAPNLVPVAGAGATALLVLLQTAAVFALSRRR